ncbi:hypothetical protein GDO78_020697 [Eleutherodactylus coqui]|uniref:Uncharacterized protein n=1 Tax=Eleutherodactylus coqui TaxID=57060 RepID=A0A8J6EI54_ELECQ|nr:hypothetical protein GDO78_020697 [Eleutherodactylus coqui]
MDHTAHSLDKLHVSCVYKKIEIHVSTIQVSACSAGHVLLMHWHLPVVLEQQRLSCFTASCRSLKCDHYVHAYSSVSQPH